MSTVIYVRLMNEGTDVWRPVHAERVRDDIYEITVDRIPEAEEWQFPPHSLVRCREHKFGDGRFDLAAYELAARC